MRNIPVFETMQFIDKEGPVDPLPWKEQGSIWKDFWRYTPSSRRETFIDQKTKYVDIHRPDGKPDLLQQIEHGTLQLIAQF